MLKFLYTQTRNIFIIKNDNEPWLHTNFDGS